MALHSTPLPTTLTRTFGSVVSMVTRSIGDSSSRFCGAALPSLKWYWTLNSYSPSRSAVKLNPFLPSESTSRPASGFFGPADCHLPRASAE